jgi:hypothetical protein
MKNKQSMALISVSVAFGVVAASAQAVSASETIWWRTNGAAVKEHADSHDGAVCSLSLYGPDAKLAVTWTKSGAETINFAKNDWWYQPGQQLAVAVEIGGSLLLGPLGGKPPHLMA